MFACLFAKSAGSTNSLDFVPFFSFGIDFGGRGAGGEVGYGLTKILGAEGASFTLRLSLLPATGFAGEMVPCWAIVRFATKSS